MLPVLLAVPGIGLALQALGGLSRSYLEAPVRLRPGADGIGLETLFEKQPRDAGLDSPADTDRLRHARVHADG